MMFPVSIALAVALASAHVLLKHSAVSTGWLKLGLVGGALALFVAVFGVYTYALRFIDVGKLYPTYTGISVALIFVAGALFFREPVTLKAVLGCVCIMVGIYLLGSGDHGAG